MSGYLTVIEADDPVATLRFRLELASEAVDECRRAYQDPSLPAGTQRYNRARMALNQALKAKQDIQDEILRRELTRARASHWHQRLQEREQELLVLYQDLGPQYTVLVRRLAQSEILAEQAQELQDRGYMLSPADLRRYNQEVREGVQALQRYTESQKTEIIERAQEQAMARVVDILEGAILPAAPQVWHRALAELQRQLPAGA